MQYICDTIQSGDSLQSVAAAYGVSINNLLAANPEIITQPYICPGIAISVPQPSIMPPIYTQQQTPQIQIPQIQTPQIQTPVYPTPTPIPQPSTGTGTTGTGTSTGSETLTMEQQVAALVNSERASRGLDPLTWNQNLANIARVKSDDMASNNYFSHTSPTYGSPFDMLKSFGVSYTAAGENIASGQTTAQTVMDTWMNSAGHAANILNGNFTEIGVGYSYNNGSPIWTQLFLR
jgi:uncharacterized YkwD family protein